MSICALHPKSYSTEDLILYLTGMMDLPNREARLTRLGELALPDALRADVLDLIDAMDTAQVATGPGTAAPQASVGKAPESWPAAVGTRPAQRKRW